MTLEPLEVAALEMLLAGDDPALGALREQLAGLTVASRERTGAGLFVELTVREKATPAAMAPRVWLGDVSADIPGLRHGAGFVLLVENGRLRMLEAFSYGEPWPDEITVFTLQAR